MGPRLAAYGVALLALGGGLWWFGASRYAAGEAAAEARWAAASAEAGRRFGEALAAQQATLEGVERDLSATRAQRQRVRTDIREVYRADPLAADWSREPLPASVRDAAGRGLSLPSDPGEPAAKLF